MTKDRYVTLAEVKEMLEAEADSREFTPEPEAGLGARQEPPSRAPSRPGS